MKTINGRIRARRDTTANWNAAVGFIPLDGEIIVYTDYKTITRNGQTINVPGAKIGSGNGYVQDLAFMGEAEAEALLAHIGDTDIHITSSERTKWNNKLSITDAQEVVGEALIIGRN